MSINVVYEVHSIVQRLMPYTRSVPTTVLILAGLGCGLSGPEPPGEPPSPPGGASAPPPDEPPRQPDALLEPEARAQWLMQHGDFMNGPVYHWTNLLRSDCSEEERNTRHNGPWPPHITRLIRNTPYALRGRRFDSPDLAAYFAKQEWYVPIDDAPLPPQKEVGCIRELATWEQAQRDALPHLDEIEPRLVREGFYDLFIERPLDGSFPPQGRPFTDGGDLWWCKRAAPVERGTPPCDPIEGIWCPSQGECTLFNGI